MEINYTSGSQVGKMRQNFPGSRVSWNKESLVQNGASKHRMHLHNLMANGIFVSLWTMMCYN